MNRILNQALKNISKDTLEVIRFLKTFLKTHWKLSPFALQRKSNYLTVFILNCELCYLGLQQHHRAGSVTHMTPTAKSRLIIVSFMKILVG